MEAQAAPLASALLSSARRAHAAGVTLRMQERGATPGFADLHAHNESLLEHLGEALHMQRAGLFAHHATWLARAFAARNVPITDLDASLACLREELRERLPPPAARVAAEYVDAARRAIASGPPEPEPSLDPATPWGQMAARYLMAVLEGRRDDALDIVTRPVRERTASATDVVERVLAPAQREAGRLWQREEMHVGEEHLLSRTTEHALTLISSLAPRAPRRGRRVLLTTVAGDLHDLSLRMVSTLLEIDGFEVAYLGASTPAPDVAAAARDLDVDLVVISATLDLHVRSAQELVRALRGVHDVPVIAGGTPFRVVPDLWQIVGADAQADTASEAVAAARRLTSAES